MPKYTVTSEITISVYTEVDAAIAEEAVDLALDRPMLSLCCHCARGEPDREWVTSGELDGDPYENVRVDEGGE